MIKRRLNFTRISLTDLSCSVELVFLYEGPNRYLFIACVYENTTKDLELKTVDVSAQFFCKM